MCGLLFSIQQKLMLINSQINSLIYIVIIYLMVLIYRMYIDDFFFINIIHIVIIKFNLKYVNWAPPNWALLESVLALFKYYYSLVLIHNLD